MKKTIVLAIIAIFLSTSAWAGKTIKNAPGGKRTAAQLTNTMAFPLDAGTADYWTDLAEFYAWIKAQTDVLYAAKPWYDGAAGQGSIIKFYGPSVANGGHGTWTAIQGADYDGLEGTGLTWRLPITAYPAAGTTTLLNVDQFGQMGQVDPATFAAASHNHAGSVITSGTVGAAYLPVVSESSGGIVPNTSAITDGWVLTKQSSGASAWAAPTGSGYTNLTSFVLQTPWRLFYSNTDGDVVELGFGADGEYLKSNGASSAPTWATPSGAAHDAVTLSTDLGNNLLGLSTQQLTLDNQNANIVFAGPSTGSAAAPSFRSLVDDDIPDTITASNYVAKSLYDAYTILYADTDNTPAALTVGSSTIVGRQSTGGIVAIAKASSEDMTTGTSTAIKAMTPAGIFEAIAAWMSTGNAMTLDHAAGFDPSATDYMFGYDSTANALKMGDEDGAGSKTWLPVEATIIQYTAVVNPQNVYDNDATNHWLFLSDDLPAAFTVTKLIVTCDIDPTTEPTVTFKECDGDIGCANPSTIEAVTTTDGRAVITSSIDDTAIASGHRIIAVFSDPDDAIKTMSVTVEGHF